MSALHAVGDSFEDEEEENDKANEVGPDVSCLVVEHEERFYNFLRRLIVDSIPFNDVLVVSDEVGSFFKLTQIGLRRHKLFRLRARRN